MTSLSEHSIPISEHSEMTTAMAINPYAAPGAVEPAIFTSHRVLTKPDLFMVSIVSYAGTLAAACLMGFGTMGFAGAIIAPLIAMFSATPVTMVTFFTLWAFGPREMRRWKVTLTAAFSGAASGALVLGWTLVLNADFLGFTTVAGLLGAIGATAATSFYLRSFREPSDTIAPTEPFWGDLDH